MPPPVQPDEREEVPAAPNFSEFFRTNREIRGAIEEQRKSSALLPGRKPDFSQFFKTNSAIRRAIKEQKEESPIRKKFRKKFTEEELLQPIPPPVKEEGALEERMLEKKHSLARPQPDRLSSKMRELREKPIPKPGEGGTPPGGFPPPAYVPHHKLAEVRHRQRIAAIGGVERAKQQQEARRQEDALIPQSVQPYVPTGATILGSALGAARGFAAGGPVGAVVGGALGGAGAYTVAKPIVTGEYATPGEVVQELIFGGVMPTVKVGRGIVKTALKESGKMAVATEAGQQFQSILDEGHALPMEGAIKRNMYSAGFGGIFGGIAGRAGAAAKVAQQNAVAVAKQNILALEAKVERARQMKLTDKTKGQLERWGERHKEAKEDLDYFLDNLDMFADPEKLSKAGDRALRISQILASGAKKKDFWQRLVEGREISGADELLNLAAKKSSPRMNKLLSEADLAHVRVKLDNENISLWDKIDEGLENLPTDARRKFVSKFAPLQAAEEKILESLGRLKKPVHDIAAKFETLAGTFGAAKGHVDDFDRAVTDLVRDLKGGKRRVLKGVRRPSDENILDFDQYMFWRRTEDRILSDQKAADRVHIISEQIKATNKLKKKGEPYDKQLLSDQKAELEQLRKRPGKQVGEFVGEEGLARVRRNLQAFKEKMGPERYAGLEEAGLAFQTHLDRALMRQVKSGRMSLESYQTIKADTGFYAPFTPREYENMVSNAAGGRIDSTAQYAEFIRGISKERFEDMKFTSILEKGREKIYSSTLSAERNKMMQEFQKILDMDTQGVVARKLGPKEAVNKGTHDEIFVLVDGKPVRYEVSQDIKDVLDGGARNTSAAVSATTDAVSRLFKAGATAYNIPFQVKNFMADMNRAAFVSEYGIQFNPKNRFGKEGEGLVGEFFTFGQDYWRALMAATSGVRRSNWLYRESQRANVLRSTMKDVLARGSKKDKGSLISGHRKLGETTVLKTLADVSGIIEESFKILGVQRAMKMHGAKSVKELIQRNPEAITEIRRYMGSPDFARMGEAMEAYNALFMFSNARLQGSLSDLARVTIDKKNRAAVMAKLGVSVGVPTAYLYYRNHTTYAEDYAKRSDRDRKDNFIIFMPWHVPGVDAGGNKVDQDGNPIMVRDSVELPKRGIVKLFAAQLEGSLDFARTRDPKIWNQMAKDFLVDSSPIGIGGDNPTERTESFFASMHPLISSSIAVFGSDQGRSLYGHYPLMNMQLAGAEPREQYTERTPELFVQAAQALDKQFPNAPEALRSPIKLQALVRGYTADMITQFVPREEVEGRPELLDHPLLRSLTSRFLASGRVDNKEEWQALKDADRAANTRAVVNNREARKFVKDYEEASGKTGNMALVGVISAIKEKYPIEGRDAVHNKEMADRIADHLLMRFRGISPQIRKARSIPVRERAIWMLDKLDRLPRNRDGSENSSLRELMMDTYQERNVLTFDVFRMMSLEIIRRELEAQEKKKK